MSGEGISPIPRAPGEAGAEPTAQIAESSAAGRVNRVDAPCAPRRAGRTCPSPRASRGD